MSYSIQYTKHIDTKVLKKLPRKTLKQIKDMIEKKLSTGPDLYGKPLRRTLKGYRSLRVGDYRVIFKIEKNTVLIFAIEHRSVVYKELE